jgi:DNA polymerase-3 subunit gamma/tau
MMTEPAFNALLKTLEEPPQQVLFILATTEPQKLPLTIISRTQRFDFKLADDIALEKKLSKIIKSENRRFSKEALELIIRAGQGSFRDAETVLDKILSAMQIPESEEVLRQHVEGIMGYISKNEVGLFIDLLLENQRMQAFDMLHDIQSRSGNLTYFVKEVLEECRVRMIALVRSGSSNVSLKKYMQIIKEFNDAAAQLRSSLIPVLALEMAIANVTDGKSTNSPAIKNIAAAKPLESKKEITEEIKEEVKIAPLKGNTEDNIKDCELINSKWQDILQAAKKYNHFLTAILAKVKVEPGMEDHLMELKVGSTFHKKRLENKETREILLGLFKDICGITIDYKCIIDKNNTQSSKESNSKLVEEFFN